MSPADDDATATAEGTDSAAPAVVFRARSALQDIFVVEQDGQRLLRFDHADGNDQSAVDPLHPDRLVFEYTRLVTLGVALAAARATPSPASSSTKALPADAGRGHRQGRAMAPAEPRALVVGLGGGAFPSWLVRHDARVVVDVVEHDPVVVDVARRFFFLPATPRLFVHPCCGAAFVARARQGYGLVLLDAFSGGGIPPALSTAAFFADVRRVVADDGIVMLNVALVTRDDTAAITRCFAAAFPGAVLVRGRREDNVVLFGARRPLSPREVEAAMASAVDVVGLDVSDDVGAVRSCG